MYLSNNGKGQVSLFSGIPEMLSNTKSSFSFAIVSHHCGIDACFFIARRLPEALGKITFQITLIPWPSFLSQRSTRKTKKRLIVLHFILCIKTNNKQDKYLQDMLITFACHNVVWKFLFVMNLVLLL